MAGLRRARSISATIWPYGRWRAEISNGDGYADIVAGNYIAANSPAGQTTGAAYIIFGRPRQEFPPQIDIDYSTSLPHPDVVIWGELLEKYPTRLAIGDLDGDGIDDLLASTISGPGEFDMVPGIGEIHGWWGKPEWQSIYYTQIDEFDFSLQGAGTYTVGSEMTTGDLDGDGRDDLIVGSLTGSGAAPPDRRSMGEYRIIFGRPRGEWPIWGNAVDLTNVLIVGAHTGDAGTTNGPFEWGIAFSLATGTRDGDGYEDLLIGAGGLMRPDGTEPGGGYVICGRRRSAWEPVVSPASSARGAA